MEISIIEIRVQRCITDMLYQNHNFSISLSKHISSKALVAQLVHPLRVNKGGLVTSTIQENGLRVDQSYHLIMINLKYVKALPFH